MARKLKYRVWITPWGNSEPYMHYIPDLQLNIYFGNWERGGYKNAVFQEFTGLFDSTGKEIYEGDILKSAVLEEENIAVITYNEEYCSFLHGENAMWKGWLGESVVLGNIFENPELLG